MNLIAVCLTVIFGTVMSQGEPQSAAPLNYNTGDTAWLLTSTALVLFMSIPGLFLFYGGLVRQKNVLSVVMHCMMMVCVLSVLWVIIGYTLCFGTHGMLKGVLNYHSFLGSFDKVFLLNVESTDVVNQVPEFVFIAYQMTFAIICPALIIGAFAERMKFNAVVVFTVLWSVLVYYPVCHTVWGGDGSLFGDLLGVKDFAGGIVVHITAGVAALVTCLYVGCRVDATLEPHNLVLTAAGTGMLWVGWFGFNGGSAGGASPLAARALLNSQVSAAVAGTVWMIIDQILDGHAQILGICTGAVAGLAGITPAAGYIGVPGAAVIGLTCAIVCRFFAIQVKNRFGYDDTLDVFNVHGVAGYVGTLLLGIVCWEGIGGTVPSSHVLTQLGSQALATLLVTIYTAVVTYVILLVCSLLCRGIRVHAKIEEEGLDKSVHNEQGYMLFITDKKEKGGSSSDETEPLLAYSEDENGGIKSGSKPIPTATAFGENAQLMNDSPYGTGVIRGGQGYLSLNQTTDTMSIKKIDSHIIMIAEDLPASESEASI
eukprot:TRINITY_DN2844_c0_g1_i6.p1 TRINITY_DN2844_c0_g1~~TRINITY_DN2844_c0_g1_i6.p1  ORF type:complete len:540 (+),score=96.24 TRINITY_DN2844_c0_g1_i6:198-1817(+)